MPTGESTGKVEEGMITGHRQGLDRIVDLLIDKEHGVIQDKSEISAMGHLLVYGGEPDGY